MGDENMLAKIWKKLLLAIVVIACLFNIVSKFVFHPSIYQELESSSKYVQEQQEKN